MDMWVELIVNATHIFAKGEDRSRTFARPSTEIEPSNLPFDRFYLSVSLQQLPNIFGSEKFLSSWSEEQVIFKRILLSSSIVSLLDILRDVFKSNRDDLS